MIAGHVVSFLTVERVVFTRLSIFRGGFTREGAQAVTGATLRTLARLVNKSLVRHDPAGRYDLHELLRQYGEEKLNTSPQENEAVRSLHAAYYTEFLHQRWASLKTNRQPAMVDEIEAEIDNVRSAWHTMCRERQIADLSKSFNSLWSFYDLRDRLQEGLQLFGQAVDALRLAPAELETDILLGDLLARQSWFYSTLGRPDLGKTVAEESISILRRSQRKDDVLIGLDGLAMTYFMVNSDWLFRSFREGGQKDPEFTHPAAISGSQLLETPGEPER